MRRADRQTNGMHQHGRARGCGMPASRQMAAPAYGGGMGIRLIDFSKGSGADRGVIAGSSSFNREVWRWKQRLGDHAPSGVCAAACICARNHVDRLATITHRPRAARGCADPGSGAAARKISWSSRPWPGVSARHDQGIAPARRVLARADGASGPHHSRRFRRLIEEMVGFCREIAGGVSTLYRVIARSAGDEEAIISDAAGLLRGACIGRAISRTVGRNDALSARANNRRQLADMTRERLTLAGMAQSVRPAGGVDTRPSPRRICWPLESQHKPASGHRDVAVPCSRQRIRRMHSLPCPGLPWRPDSPRAIVCSDLPCSW